MTSSLESAVTSSLWVDLPLPIAEFHIEKVFKASMGGSPGFMSIWTCTWILCFCFGLSVPVKLLYNISITMLLNSKPRLKNSEILRTQDYSRDHSTLPGMERGKAKVRTTNSSCVRQHSTSASCHVETGHKSLERHSDHNHDKKNGFLAKIILYNYY